MELDNLQLISSILINISYISLVGRANNESSAFLTLNLNSRHLKKMMRMSMTIGYFLNLSSILSS